MLSIKTLFFSYQKNYREVIFPILKTKQLRGKWAVQLRGYIRHLSNAKEKLNFGIIVC